MAEIMQPFRMGTRRHRMILDNVAHSNGTQLESIEIKPAGWAAGLIVEAELSVVTGAAPAWGDNGVWGIVNRFNVELNGQSFQPIDIDGYSAYVAQLARRNGGAPNRVHWGGSAVDSNYFVDTLSANTTQTVKVLWYLPFSINTGVNMESGLIPLLARELSGYLKITTNGLASVGTGITGITRTWKTTLVYFNAPAPVSLPNGDVIKYANPPLQGVRLISYDTLIKADLADTPIVLPKEGTIIEAAHVIRVNGVRRDYFDELRLVLGNQNIQDRANRSTVKFENAIRYGEMPTGVVFHQLSDDFESNMLGLRDALDTTNISLSESVVKVNTGGAGLGGANNLITTILRIQSAYNYKVTN